METLQRTANRGSISTGFDIDNSLKFEPDNSEYLGKTPTSSGNRRTFTISMWIKRTEIGVDSYLLEAGDGDYNQSDRTLIKFDATDNFRFGGGSGYQRITNRVFRDTSAWYHIVMAVDTTDSTAGNRLKLYVNGVQETSFSTSSDPDQNFQYAFCKDDEHTVGYNHTDNGSYYPGYMSEVILIDGQQLDPTSFGEFDEDTGIWKPIDVSGLSFGTNGFYLDFKDASNLGNDASGGTDFTLNNITSADQAVDSPTNSFATMTEAWAYASQLEVRWGGTLTSTNTAAWSGAKSTIGVNKGKWYWEIRWNDTISTYTGIQTQGEDNISASGSAAHARNTSLSIGAGSKYRTYINGTDTLFSSQPSGNISTGEVTGFALDLDSGTKTLKLIRSGSVVQTYTLTDSLATEYVFPFCSTYAQTLVWNLGGFFHYSLSSAETDANGLGLFEFSPTIGGVNYYALCTKNLAEYG